METVATVCDDIIECHDVEDEPEFCKHNDGNTYLAISVGSILAIYLGLKFYSNIIKKKKRNSIINRQKVMLMLKTRISNEREMTALRQKINCLCLHIKNYFDQKAKVKIGSKIFAELPYFSKNFMNIEELF